MIKERFRKIKLDKERAENNATKLKKKNQQLKNLKAELNQELEKAKKLHHKFLPTKLPQTKDISSAVYYQAAKKLGGDFYNFIEYNGKLIAYIVDIMGHGLDGALLSIFVRETINNFLANKPKQQIKPDNILQFLYHKYNQEDFSDDYFICIGLFVLNIQNKKLIYSNAGLQIPTLLIRKSEVQQLICKGLPISKDIAPPNYEFNQLKLTLNPTDKFLLMTDGIVEQSKNQKRYGLTRVEKIIYDNRNLAIDNIIANLMADSREFIDYQPQNDDITLIGIEFKR